MSILGERDGGLEADGPGGGVGGEVNLEDTLQISPVDIHCRYYGEIAPAVPATALCRGGGRGEACGGGCDGGCSGCDGSCGS